MGSCWSTSDEDESPVTKPRPFSHNQPAEPKKASENVAHHHHADGGRGEAQDGENVDKKAEDFIGRMKAAMKAERLKSMKRFQSMLNRGT